ncbi:MAG: DUF167 domain-containing protein [candidate division WOR-3 bacterium]
MRIFIKVKCNAKENRIISVNDNKLIVYVTEPPIEGKANRALIKLLSEHFKIPQSNIILEKGLKSKHKIVLIKNI